MVVVKKANRWLAAIAGCAMSCCMLGCAGDDEGVPDDYRQSMREFIRDISGWAKARTSGFLIIAQNGQELLTADGEADGETMSDYIGAIDGVGREDLFYGYDADDEATPAQERDYMIGLCDVAKSNGLAVLVTDYCSTSARMDDSYSKNDEHGYISFAAPHRELDIIPSYPAVVHNYNTATVTNLVQAQNFLYLINPQNFSSRSTYINMLSLTTYDVFIIDAFFGDRMLTPTEVSFLKHQAGPRDRLVIAYMSIGEAEDYRYYWDSTWAASPPSWLAGENPDWEGNYKVRYWEQGWQDLIFGSDSTYLGKIIAAGFDGVYLDIIDAFEYFE